MCAMIDTGNPKLTRLRKERPCDGCGRLLPKGSDIHRRHVSEFGERRSMTWCESCWSVMRECGDGKVNIFGEQDVRQCCLACDDYPLCGTAAYLRDSRPGDLTMECVRQV